MGKLNKKGLEMKCAFKKEMKEKRKNMKNVLKANRAKLLVRNLSFKANEQNLQSLFGQYGEIENINILKKSDGKMIGCAFIQFKLVQKAAKARHHLNGHIFFDRAIEVDFAKAKDKYKKEMKIQTQVKTETENDVIDLSIVKTEDSEDTNIKVKDELETNCENTNENNTEDSDSSVSSEESTIDTEASKTNIKNDLVKKPHISNDISEGKTVFIKNVPFSATNQDLRQCMSQFGPVYYALICVDNLTEHSKGTAFVKFRNKEDAERCLQAGTELILQGNILDCHTALNKNDLVKREKEKKMKQKDSRNLYLVKEGVILAGTNASEGVSTADMAKRLQLEQYKTQMLRNLNMYVSKTRLIIHNIPPTWNDAKLRTLFKNHSNDKAVIREAKIMRDMRNLDSHGIGKSKEYGFVSFTNHEDALEALRSLNNNPTIFSANKRPIVAFSIESRTVLKAKERRLQRSKIQNPNSKNYNPDINKKEENIVNKKKQNEREISTSKKAKLEKTQIASEKFTGVIGRPGIKEMRSKYNLKKQAKLHFENSKKEKKRIKKNVGGTKKDFRKQTKQKLIKKEEVDNFSVLVNKYKQNLKNIPSKTFKWYE